VRQSGELTKKTTLWVCEGCGAQQLSVLAAKEILVYSKRGSLCVCVCVCVCVCACVRMLVRVRVASNTYVHAHPQAG
jgi:hypothetical protein